MFDFVCEQDSGVLYSLVNEQGCIKRTWLLTEITDRTLNSGRDLAQKGEQHLVFTFNFPHLKLFAQTPQWSLLTPSMRPSHAIKKAGEMVPVTAHKVAPRLGARSLELCWLQQWPFLCKELGLCLTSLLHVQSQQQSDVGTFLKTSLVNLYVPQLPSP